MQTVSHATSYLLSLYNKATPLISAKVTWARERSYLFDFSYTSTLRLIHEVGLRAFGTEVFDPSALKTARERRWEAQCNNARRRLDPTARKFFESTAGCADAHVRRSMGEGMRQIPSQIEYVFFYWVSLPARYIWRQFNIRGGREGVAKERSFQLLAGQFCGLTARVAHSFGKSTLDSLVNIELLLLEAYQKLTKKPVKPLPIKETVFSRIACSLGQQSDIQKIWQDPSYPSDEEKRIAVLAWLKEKGDLPAGLPNPEGLFTHNLAEKEREALFCFFYDLIEKHLDRHLPKFFQSGIPWLLYEAEGKRKLIKSLADVAIQVFVNQVANPTNFAQAILFSEGEVLDIELDAYGPEKNVDLLSAGHRILQAVADGKSIDTVSQILNESGLKRAPGGAGALEQKKETKRRLQALVKKNILQTIQSRDHKDLGKEGEPIIGAGSLSWRILMQMMNTTIIHLKQLNFFVAEQAKEAVADYFAGRMVDLIYHPSWKILLLQLTESLVELAENPGRAPKDIRKEDFDQIADFFGRHFFGVIEARSLPTVHTAQTVTWAIDKVLRYAGYNTSDDSLGTLMTRVFYHFKGEDLFSLAKKALQSEPGEGKDMLQEGMKSLIPSISEPHLYCKLIDAVRKKGTPFPDDSKFWEVFLRLSIPKLMESEEKSRQEIIENLLTLSDDELIHTLVGLDVPNLISVGDNDPWVDLAKEKRA